MADLVRSNVELLVAIGSEIALQAAMAASPIIPIVMWANSFDPIARGYVKSLAQPGDRLTDRFGISGIVLMSLHIGLYIGRRHQPHSMAKRLEFTRPMVRRSTGFDTD